MSLNSTPSSMRIQISFFGKTNSGKSSLINAITNQNVSIVSDIKGTTTDPVSKSMELLPLGAVVLNDTAGYDDKSELGQLRLQKTMDILKKTDIALLVVDSTLDLDELDKKFIKLFEENNIKYIIVHNKSDLLQTQKENGIYVSSITGKNINELKEKIASFNVTNKQTLVGDLINENDRVILVTPIDLSAPKGRMILPQQQVLRDILDNNGICIVTKETQLKETLKTCNNPKLVITDSQVFGIVNNILDENIKLTSFSILFARYKGILKQAVEGAKQIEELKNGDKILISEGCTHHRQCEDIGTVKLPKWLKEYSKKELDFEFTSGLNFKEELKKYKMIIHCGGCMLSDREVINRYKLAEEQNIAITNYGIIIAYIKGILNRSIAVFQ